MAGSVRCQPFSIEFHDIFNSFVLLSTCRVCVCVALHALLCLHQNRVPFYCLWFFVGWSFFLFCFSRRGLQCNDLCVGRSVATDVLSMLRTRFTTLIYLFRCKLGKIDDHFRYIPGAHTHCERDTRRERGKNQITKSKEHAQICSRSQQRSCIVVVGWVWCMRQRKISLNKIPKWFALCCNCKAIYIFYFIGICVVRT